jgi:hypothetical protein
MSLKFRHLDAVNSNLTQPTFFFHVLSRFRIDRDDNQRWLIRERNFHVRFNPVRRRHIDELLPVRDNPESAQAVRRFRNNDFDEFWRFVRFDGSPANQWRPFRAEQARRRTLRLDYNHWYYSEPFSIK